MHGLQIRNFKHISNLSLCYDKYVVSIVTHPCWGFSFRRVNQWLREKKLKQTRPFTKYQFPVHCPLRSIVLHRILWQRLFPLQCCTVQPYFSNFFPFFSHVRTISFLTFLYSVNLFYCSAAINRSSNSMKRNVFLWHDLGKTKPHIVT